MNYVYAYCHGFLSNENSYKGVWTARKVEQLNIKLNLLNLNGGGPDASTLTLSSAIDAINYLWETHVKSASPRRLRLIGSSLGGYIVSYYASIYPERVDCIVLLCPAFQIATLMTSLATKEWMGQHGEFHQNPTELMLNEWKDSGSLPFDSLDGKTKVDVQWALYADLRNLPDFPNFQCRALILHGKNDDTVPLSVLETFMMQGNAAAKKSMLYQVDDSHALTKPTTLSFYFDLLVSFFELAPNCNQRELGTPNCEIEQKFLISSIDYIQDQLKENGATLLHDQTFWDIYWDLDAVFPGPLLLHDCWLRERAGRWEMKVPRVMKDEEKESYAVYEELQRDPLIYSYLMKNFLSNDTSEEKTPGEILTESGGESICCVMTHRLHYVLPSKEGSFVIFVDVDTTPDLSNHIIVEIEISGDAQSNIKTNEELEGILVRTADSLGLQSRTTMSKFEAGLKSQCGSEKYTKFLDLKKRLKV